MTLKVFDLVIFSFISRGDSKQQEHIVEIYFKLLTTALEDEYFICDYNSKYPVENQNDVFESCAGLYPLMFLL